MTNIIRKMIANLEAKTTMNSLKRFGLGKYILFIIYYVNLQFFTFLLINSIISGLMYLSRITSGTFKVG